VGNPTAGRVQREKKGITEGRVEGKRGSCFLGRGTSTGKYGGNDTKGGRGGGERGLRGLDDKKGVISCGEFNSSQGRTQIPEIDPLPGRASDHALGGEGVRGKIKDYYEKRRERNNSNQP